MLSKDMVSGIKLTKNTGCTMRDEKIVVNETDMIAKIDLCKNAVYAVVDGQIKHLDTPPTGFGKQEINWQHGKPTHSEIKYIQKF